MDQELQKTEEEKCVLKSIGVISHKINTLLHRKSLEKVGIETTTVTPTARIDEAAHSRSKLPKLLLKEFNGDITEWDTLWDSFDSAIHTNSSLSDIKKFGRDDGKHKCEAGTHLLGQ
uniref:Uncharacterized protein n=1 Tax=Amphimedon queenslandica TaxID=400682 RepID=A0A1X7UBB6_AMPQE